MESEVVPAGAGIDRLNRAWLDPSPADGGVSRPPPDCPACDIPPAKALGPVDEIDGTRGARAGLLDRGRHGGDVEHTAAVGQHALAGGPAFSKLGAGMEDLHAFDLGRRLEPADLGSLLIGVGIAL